MMYDEDEIPGGLMETVDQIVRLALQYKQGVITHEKFRQSVLEVVANDRNATLGTGRNVAPASTVSFVHPHRCERARCGRHFRDGFIIGTQGGELVYACSETCANLLQRL